MSTLNVKKVGSGVFLQYGDVKLALDTGIRGEITLLSHSHSDHIGGLAQARHIIATKATIDTWNARNSESNPNTSEMEIGDVFGQIGVSITLLNAGHVLGSTMFHLEFDDGLKVLYTGDFNNVDSLVHFAAKPVEADVLIMEATYGAPPWNFPDRNSIYERILDAANRMVEEGRTPVFHAYSLGKSQEAIALLQRGGFNVISGNQSIDKVCSVYEHHGVTLKHFTLKSPNITGILKEGAVIVSSSLKHTIFSARKHLDEKAVEQLEKRSESYNLSGWSIGKFAERGFPLSAHSDFNGLLSFAREVSPRVAYVFTNNAGIFSKHLSDIGINAVPLE